jgi:membrane-bound metal-dependent hydrolase YbcI (DUF457 family)
MLLWFAGMSFLVVWQVFRDPAIDYRLVMAAAIVPDVLDGAAGGARVLHTLLAACVVLIVVMLATRGRKVWRRRALAIPIGMFCHLLLDGVWTDGELFWWPAMGGDFADRPLPSFDRPVLLIVAMEAVGAVALVRSWRAWRQVPAC